MSASAAAAAAAASASLSSPAPHVSGAKWKGRVLKRFKLVDILGQGSMGKVFRAEDITLRRHVALKVLPTRTREGQRDHKIDQFVREARSAASVEHPHAVTVYEVGEASGVHYIAMELVEGGNLEKLVRASGPLEIERACSIAAEAAEALSAAHAQQIIHRDVKPSNLLLSRNGRCKLADFGLARYEDPDDPNSVRGECVGTPCYIAPELPLGQKATPQSDIYSLGCTLWFLLIGKPPFEARTKHDMMKMHVYAALPDIRDIRPEIAPRLAETIQRACAKNPDDRFESADQFAKVLRTFTIPTISGSSQRLPTLSGGGGSLTGSSPGWAPEPGMSASSTSLPNSSANLAPMMQSSANLGGSMSASNGAMAAAPGSDTIQILGRRLPLSPLLWAGIGTAAAVVLIGIGVWIARGSSSNGAAASVPSAPQVSAPAAIRSGSNAVANGALDLGDDASAPGWFVPPPYKHAISFVSEDGNRFLRIKNEDPKATVFIDQKIKVEPTWTAVTVSARIRATNFKSGSGAAHDARVAMKFIDDADQRVGNWPPVPTVKGDSPWVERTITADVPPGAKHLYLQLAVFYATGTVDFDDVKVIPQIKSTK